MSTPSPAPDRITRRIGDAIKGQIASGLLGPGAKLPSTRSLAAEWGVSRSTVTLAYEQLIAEGYLDVRQGARASVSRSLEPPGASTVMPSSLDLPDRLSAFAQRLAGFTPPAPTVDRGPSFVDFRYGDLAADDFPVLA